MKTEPLGDRTMPSEISNSEAIEMMRRCKDDILRLRAVIERLKPKADAYDNLAVVLSLLPKPNVGMGEDIVWILDKRIRELQPPPPPVNPSSSILGEDVVGKQLRP